MKLISPTTPPSVVLHVLRISTVLLGFAMPISVALDNILLALLLLGALFNLPIVWRIIVHHPVARAACLMFTVLFIAIFYGGTPLREANSILGKYIDLAFIPIFMTLLSDESMRRRSQHAFLYSMGMTLILSYLVGLDLLPPQSWMNQGATPGDPAIFHSHITQNNMMAFAIFLALFKMRDSATAITRLAWGIFALLAVTNVLFMVKGRTGYVILMILLIWFSWVSLMRFTRKRGQILSWKHATALCMAALILIALAYSLSPKLQQRVHSTVAEVHAWQPNVGNRTDVGARLDFYYDTLKIIGKYPVFGVGTGGFPAAFTQQTQGKDIIQTPNPHNEYMMISVQTGVIGLVVLLYLFYTLWRYAPQLVEPFEQDAARGLVLAYLINCLFNSALLDHADGLFFAFMTAVLFAGFKPDRNLLKKPAVYG